MLFLFTFVAGLAFVFEAFTLVVLTLALAAAFAFAFAATLFAASLAAETFAHVGCLFDAVLVLTLCIEAAVDAAPFIFDRSPSTPRVLKSCIVFTSNE